MSNARATRATAPRGDLAAVANFAVSLRLVSWFVAVGQPLTPSESREAQDYAVALGLGDLAVREAGDWRTAERATRDPHWDAGWWQAEDAARSALLQQLKTTVDTSTLMTALTQVTNEATNIVLGAASVAASRDGIADQALARVAAGSATQAAYQAALALAAGAGSAHPFASKFRLFAAGRWLLGIDRGAILVF